MAIYTCTVCGYTYDEAKGIPEEGILPGTKWEGLADDWTCPLCGASKSEFEILDEEATTDRVEPSTSLDHEDDLRELSPLEMGILCSNLANGCEKQYKFEEAALFTQLGTYFKGQAGTTQDSDFSKLLNLIENDLEQGFPEARLASSKDNDRGALRALTWSEKVTKILKSLLTRYQKKGDEMLENTGVYVCTICGFIYVGNNLPEVCPVCKVANWKFEKIERR